MVLFNFINNGVCIMDSGETLSKKLAEHQKNLQLIQQKLQEPECAHIDQMLAKIEYQPIRKALLKKPELFLLLLNSPTFGLFLTENTKEGFLKDLKENPDRLTASLIQSQTTQSDQMPQSLQSSMDSHADEEIDLVQETINQVYEQVANFAAVYTPSLNNVSDAFSSFVEGLSCAVNELSPETPDIETKRANQPKK